MDDMGFKFKVGDVVTTHTAIRDVTMMAAAGEAHLPHSGTIVERMYQECPGGVQRHYAVRLSHSKEFSRLNEIEVAPLSDFDHAAVIKTANAAKDAERNRQRQSDKEWSGLATAVYDPGGSYDDEQERHGPAGLSGRLERQRRRRDDAARLFRRPSSASRES